MQLTDRSSYTSVQVTRAYRATSSWSLPRLDQVRSFRCCLMLRRLVSHLWKDLIAFDCCPTPNTILLPGKLSEYGSKRQMVTYRPTNRRQSSLCMCKGMWIIVDVVELCGVTFGISLHIYLAGWFTSFLLILQRSLIIFLSLFVVLREHK